MLYVTLGDPHSINIECLLSVLGSKKPKSGLKVTLIGSLWHWQNQCRRLNIEPEPLLEALGVRFIDIDAIHPARAKDWMQPAEQLEPSQRGSVALASLLELKRLTAHAQPGSVSVLTCPIDKAATQSAGLQAFPFAGHTEFFADLWQGEALMLLAGPKLKVALASTHIALKEVADTLTPERVARRLDQLVAAFGQLPHLLTPGLGLGLSLDADDSKDQGGAAHQTDTTQLRLPRIAVSGLNPHCSDGGLFGTEEQSWLNTCVAEARRAHLGSAQISGPWPADTVFYRTYQGEFDAVLAMYHDQGLGPLKTVHFSEAINITCGLKHVRTSPDHGPARDLFLKRRADDQSFARAFDVAAGALINHSSLSGSLT